MDAFLEDGSHEATLAVIRALVVAIPRTTEQLRDYILKPPSFLQLMPVLEIWFCCCNIMYIFFFNITNISCPRFSNLQPHPFLQVMWCGAVIELMHFLKQFVLLMQQVCFWTGNSSASLYSFTWFSVPSTICIGLKEMKGKMKFYIERYTW